MSNISYSTYCYGWNLLVSLNTSPGFYVEKKVPRAMADNEKLTNDRGSKEQNIFLQCCEPA